jgi:hypothetical protein
MQPPIIDTYLIGKSGLKWTLPIILKRLQTHFRATALIAHPTKTVSEKSTNIINPMVIQTINHALDNTPCVTGFGHIGIAG